MLIIYLQALGLNEHHQNIVVNYLRFARYQRTQRLRAVDLSFQDLKDSRYMLLCSKIKKGELTSF